MAGALFLLVGAKSGTGLAQRLAEQAVTVLKTTGRFNKDFDYDAMGTRFFKTSVNGRRVQDKYVLELNAAYVGREPEKELAKTIGKPMALASSSVKAYLSIVDDWWFNANLEQLLEGLPITKEQIKDLPRYIASGGNEGQKPNVTFTHEGITISLSVWLDADRYLRPEGADYGRQYLQARGTSLVGGAWTTWADNGNDKIPPKAILPSILISVSTPGKDWEKPVAVTRNEVHALEAARNYLAELIRINNKISA